MKYEEKPTKCPYCGGQVVHVNSRKVYSKDFGMMYKCEDWVCDSYVGCHQDRPDIALGTLANKATRYWRKQAHAHFDPLWKEKMMTRKEAYKFLREALNLKEKDCHIGHFDIYRCKDVIEVCRDFKNTEHWLKNEDSEEHLGFFKNDAFDDIEEHLGFFKND